jgi:hypothetical protein
VACGTLALGLGLGLLGAHNWGRLKLVGEYFRMLGEYYRESWSIVGAVLVM